MPPAGDRAPCRLRRASPGPAERLPPHLSRLLLAAPAIQLKLRQAQALAGLLRQVQALAGGLRQAQALSGELRQAQALSVELRQAQALSGLLPDCSPQAPPGIRLSAEALLSATR